LNKKRIFADLEAYCQNNGTKVPSSAKQRNKSPLHSLNLKEQDLMDLKASSGRPTLLIRERENEREIETCKVLHRANMAQPNSDFRGN
jgi:hypothetical protein